MWTIECWSGGDLLGSRYKYDDLDDGTEVLRFQLQEDIDLRIYEIDQALERLEREKKFLLKNSPYLTEKDVLWPD